MRPFHTRQRRRNSPECSLHLASSFHLISSRVVLSRANLPRIAITTPTTTMSCNGMLATTCNMQHATQVKSSSVAGEHPAGDPGRKTWVFPFPTKNESAAWGPTPTTIQACPRHPRMNWVARYPGESEMNECPAGKDTLWDELHGVYAKGWLIIRDLIWLQLQVVLACDSRGI